MRYNAGPLFANEKLNYLFKLVKDHKVDTTIDKVFKFEDALKAFDYYYNDPNPRKGAIVLSFVWK